MIEFVGFKSVILGNFFDVSVHRFQFIYLT